jgi:hypothetical protein
MNVRPALLWVLILGSALAGALASTLFEGFIDNYLGLRTSFEKFGLAQILGESGSDLAEEALSTIFASILAAALVGLVTYMMYTAFVSKRS